MSPWLLVLAFFVVGTLFNILRDFGRGNTATSGNEANEHGGICLTVPKRQPPLWPDEVAADGSTSYDAAERRRFEEVERDYRRRIKPDCMGLAQGVLPSQSELGIGLPTVGGRSIAIGRVAINVENLDCVGLDPNPASTAEHLRDHWPEHFRDFDAAFVRLFFRGSRTSNIDRIILGFGCADEAVAVAEQLGQWGCVSVQNERP